MHDDSVMDRELDVSVRKGKRGYVGYYGNKGHLQSTRIVRPTRGRARRDAIDNLVWIEAASLVT